MKDLKHLIVFIKNISRIECKMKELNKTFDCIYKNTLCRIEYQMKEFNIVFDCIHQLL